MNFRILGLIVPLGLNAAACSPGPMPVSQSPKDPSNPAAEEGAPPLSLLASTTQPNLSQRSSDGVSEHMGHHHEHSNSQNQQVAASADGGPGTVVYVCPMHPEVTSSSPGRCPKCGMDLVPKK